MKVGFRVLLFLLLAACISRAAGSETLDGELTFARSDSAVLTLALPAEKLGALADKAGQERTLTTDALVELIRERFHFLLRLRVGEQEFAPTEIQLTPVNAAAASNGAHPDFVLVARWTNPDARGGALHTQSDVPGFRLELSLREKGNDSHSTMAGGASRPGTGAAPVLSAAASSPTPPSPQIFSRLSGPWWKRVLLAGAESLLLALGLALACRDRRALALRLSVFGVMQAAVAATALVLVRADALAQGSWIALLISLTFLALAATILAEFEPGARVGLAFVAGAGAIHGLGFARIWGPGIPPQSELAWSAATAVITLTAAELAVLGLVLGSTTLFLTKRAPEKFFSPPRFTIPATVAITLVGLALTWERVGANGASP